MVSGSFFFSAELFCRHGFQRNDLGATLHRGGISSRLLAQQWSHQFGNPPLPCQLFLNIPALLRQPGKRLADSVSVVAREDRPRNRGADDDRLLGRQALLPSYHRQFPRRRLIAQQPALVLVSLSVQLLSLVGCMSLSGSTL